MAALITVRITLLLTLISYVAAKSSTKTITTEDCALDKGVLVHGKCILPDHVPKPLPRAQQTIPDDAIIVPEAVYNKTSDNGFKPLSVRENLYVQSVCGKAHESFARIRYGQKARPKQFPWALTFGFCSGVLISPRHVLTAAHCFIGGGTERGPCSPHYVADLEKHNLHVQYGGNCVRKTEDCPNGENTKEATYTRLIYPRGDPRHCNFYNDIAVILLEEDVEFDEYVNPICIASLYPENLTQYRNVGFGVTSNGVSTTILRYMDAKLTQVPNYREIVTRGVPNSEGVPDTCHGDSGGPVQATFYGSPRTYLAGVHSRGTVCSYDAGKVTSAYVPAYADWICTLTGVCELD